MEPIEVTAGINSKVVPSSPPENTEEIIALPMLRDCKLADRQLGKKNDVVIGSADLHHFMLNEVKYDEGLNISAANTVFGWAMHGPSTNKTATSLATSSTDTSDDSVLKKMYTLEQVPSATTLTTHPAIILMSLSKFNE